MAKSVIAVILVWSVERELAVRLGEQARDTNESDRRDRASLIALIPVANMYLAE